MVKLIEKRKRTTRIAELKYHEKIHMSAVMEGLTYGGNVVVSEIKRLISSPPKTGRTYYFRGSQHQASAPGEAPANRSGKLLNSSDYRISSGGSNIYMEVFENAPYAKYLELGTKKMAPRPHFFRAARSKENDITNAIVRAGKKGLFK